MELLFCILAFFCLVFIALTYDRTVTPALNWFNKTVERLKGRSQKEQKEISSFRLYDGTIYVFILGLIYLTYEAFEPGKSLDQKLIAIPSVVLLWLLILFKIHRIDVIDSKTIIFWGLFRKIYVSSQDILVIQDWLRGIRVVFNNRSLILWPYIEKQAQFKTLLSHLNPDIKMKDMSNEATKTTAQGGLIILAMFLYFGWLIWNLFQEFTQNF